MKCVIAEVTNDRAVLLNEFGEFMTVASKNYEVGQKIEYTQYKHSQFRYIAASFILLMMISLSSYAIYYTPVSYMSVDINPSIQLGINRFDKVINVQPLNEDAKILLDTIKLGNQDINQSVDMIIEASKSMGYLTEENNQIEIDVVTKSNKLMDQINNHMSNYEDDKIDVAVERANNDELDLSKELKVSIGRTKVILKYTEAFGGDVKENVNQLSTISVGEIKKTVKAKQANDLNAQPQQPNKPNNDAQESNQTQKDIINKENKAGTNNQDQGKKDNAESVTNKVESKDVEGNTKKQENVKQDGNKAETERKNNEVDKTKEK